MSRFYRNGNMLLDLAAGELSNEADAAFSCRDAVNIGSRMPRVEFSCRLPYRCCQRQELRY